MNVLQDLFLLVLLATAADLCVGQKLYFKHRDFPKEGCKCGKKEKKETWNIRPHLTFLLNVKWPTILEQSRKIWWQKKTKKKNSPIWKV